MAANVEASLSASVDKSDDSLQNKNETDANLSNTPQSPELEKSWPHLMVSRPYKTARKLPEVMDRLNIFNCVILNCSNINLLFINKNKVNTGKIHPNMALSILSLLIQCKFDLSFLVWFDNIIHRVQ
ncbi:hypothetical protein Phum_PHUM530200 [Pediculus humanus corporis]|uniref:Uncharacterized protein n=1 Tax=Pediculus humanus subsp. corporis TaxID=121224 RepID=E0VZC9_PEDHC|nr:uncharacterized protein Phum_PHUM530200 [Pediculus humanus corporis]EEB18735.1 hypothetical protein Phum_PHUM530200 [Pediculus humanus corporis]